MVINSNIYKRIKKGTTSPHRYIHPFSSNSFQLHIHIHPHQNIFHLSFSPFYFPRKNKIFYLGSFIYKEPFSYDFGVFWSFFLTPFDWKLKCNLESVIIDFKDGKVSRIWTSQRHLYYWSWLNRKRDYPSHQTSFHFRQNDCHRSQPCWSALNQWQDQLHEDCLNLSKLPRYPRLYLCWKRLLLCQPFCWNIFGWHHALLPKEGSSLHRYCQRIMGRILCQQRN